MHSKLYRFDIVRAKSNAIYDATDPLDGTPVLIYEWTPPAEERDAAKIALDELIEELLPCEAFTTDASLYLAAKTKGAAAQALAILHNRGLFTGEWDKPEKVVVVPPPDPPPVIGGTVSPPPPSKPAVKRDPPPPAKYKPPVKKSSGCATVGKGCAGVVFVLLILGAVLVIAAIVASQH